MTARWYWLAMRSPAKTIASNTRIAKIVGDMVLLQMCWSDPGEGRRAWTSMFETDRRMGANRPRGRWPKRSGTCPAGDAQQMGWRGPAGMGCLAGRPCKGTGRRAPKDHNRGEHLR